MNLIIQPNGLIRCLYDERIDLRSLGHLQIVRASEVEPDEKGKWWADLAPVGGPREGPFDRRSDALAFERQWLETHRLHPRPTLSVLRTPEEGHHVQTSDVHSDQVH